MDETEEEVAQTPENNFLALPLQITEEIVSLTFATAGTENLESEYLLSATK